MALRLRRGTDAERQNITPDIGELIYTTDTKKVYVGDGATAGGNLISTEGSGGGATSIADLTDVDVTGITDGQVLTWDAANTTFSPQTLSSGEGGGATSLNDLSDVDTTTNPPVSNSFLTYDNGSSTFVTTTELLLKDTNPTLGSALDADGNDIFAIGAITANELNSITLSGDITGNNRSILGLNQLSTNILQVQSNLVADLEGSVIGRDSTLLVDYDNSRVSLANNSPFDFNQIQFNSNTPDYNGIADGSVLVFDGVSKKFKDLRLFLNYDESHAVISGHVSGTLQGDILGDDSSLIFDGFNKTMAVNELNSTIGSIDQLSSISLTVSTSGTFGSIETNDATLGTTTTGELTSTGIVSTGFTNRGQGQIDLVRTVDGVISDSRPHGNIFFKKNDDNGELITAQISGAEQGFRFTADSAGASLNSTDDKVLSWTDGQLLVGARTPSIAETLIVHGEVASDSYTRSAGFDNAHSTGDPITRRRTIYSTIDSTNSDSTVLRKQIFGWDGSEQANAGVGYTRLVTGGEYIFTVQYDRDFSGATRYGYYICKGLFTRVETDQGIGFQHNIISELGDLGLKPTSVEFEEDFDVEVTGSELLKIFMEFDPNQSDGSLFQITGEVTMIHGPLVVVVSGY